jgi:Fe-S-cluster containining protein
MGTEQELLVALRELYREVDALYAGASCEASSECCRFGITGREPQVTSLELVLVKQAIAARGGMLKAQKRALPISADAERERVCPLLDRKARCSVYEARPLGCRTFYCTRADIPREPTRAELAGLVRKLQELAALHERDGDKPRGLSRALER